MFKKFFIFIAILGAHLATHAAEIRYESITPLKGNYSSFRDAWDKTGQFCFEIGNGEERCFTISQMAEVKLRHQGEWSKAEHDQKYIEGLSPEARANAEGFYKLYVRYLSFGPHSEFIVHVFYLKEGTPGASERGSQTIFAYGKQNEIEAMSFSGTMEYIGAIIKAATSVPVADAGSVEKLHAQIAKMHTPMLKVAEETVKIFGGQIPLQNPR